jgi:hypothetical protein
VLAAAALLVRAIALGLVTAAEMLAGMATADAGGLMARQCGIGGGAGQ